MLLYCLCGAAGQARHFYFPFFFFTRRAQHFIFVAINSFGSLVNITITTTRKFFGVLLSVFVNKSELRRPQWCAVMLVFLGLGMQVRDAP